ncbi:type IX secretion system plug protein [Reichenbachiella ulvae]|uniref:DUF5103 domain-containing protein n=1 Tax=Reichenbachiella ulvae TaxID=2980104 RepID=A0ABT3CYR8_9BACT|nr:DUF5103 domain-containing protein [Reichenbachiella ulvae]MCV9388704.1 DUF5103 domain-containing protein [Reichenbachiella ulvae]
MKSRLHLWVFVACFMAGSATAQDSQVYQNQKFDQAVGTVQLYPLVNTGDQEMRAPIITLDQTTELLLQFDMLTEEYDILQAKIIHCNSDWTKSVLNDIEFLYDYNTFDIRDFEYSENTRQLYVNYWMKMPRVKLSGNYVVQVYREGRPDDVILTRRFIVYEQNISINPGYRASTSVRFRQSNQQIDFAINYTAMDVTNPMREFKVVLRQNNRWDNAIFDLQPTSDNRANSTLEYRHFNAENNFKGGNEFRFFDIRVYNFRGINVSRIDKDNKRIDAYLATSESRGNSVYSQSRQDMNGSFFIMTNETGASYLEADYIHVHFDLKTSQVPQEVYAIGAFNDWAKNESSRLTYNPQAQSYQGVALLKQGYYDYMYWVDGDDPYLFENSFYQTENEYDILVYYRGFTDLADRVVGFASFKSVP